MLPLHPAVYHARHTHTSQPGAVKDLCIYPLHTPPRSHPDPIHPLLTTKEPRAQKSQKEDYFLWAGLATRMCAGLLEERHAPLNHTQGPARTRFSPPLSHLALTPRHSYLCSAHFTTHTSVSHVEQPPSEVAVRDLFFGSQLEASAPSKTSPRSDHHKDTSRTI